MGIEMLTADDAIARIKLCTATGGQVLGVDGIQIAAEGNIGRLDLILDLSTRTITRKAAEQEAIRFVKAHLASDIMFDVVTAYRDDIPPTTISYSPERASSATIIGLLALTVFWVVMTWFLVALLTGLFFGAPFHFSFTVGKVLLFSFLAYVIVIASLFTPPLRQK